ncbi:MAG: hypothetical protein ACK4N5_03425, partial [Myxococcales bacterium]
VHRRSDDRGLIDVDIARGAGGTPALLGVLQRSEDRGLIDVDIRVVPAGRRRSWVFFSAARIAG